HDVAASHLWHWLIAAELAEGPTGRGLLAGKDKRQQAIGQLWGIPETEADRFGGGGGRRQGAVAPGAFSPRSMLAMEISSSIAGQCKPIGMSSMSDRAVCEAAARRGYHQSGVETVRPSARRTWSSLSSHCASIGRLSSISSTKVVIP